MTYSATTTTPGTGNKGIAYDTVFMKAHRQIIGRLEPSGRMASRRCWHYGLEAAYLTGQALQGLAIMPAPLNPLNQTTKMH